MISSKLIETPTKISPAKAADAPICATQKFVQSSMPPPFSPCALRVRVLSHAHGTVSYCDQGLVEPAERSLAKEGHHPQSYRRFFGTLLCYAAVLHHTRVLPIEINP